MKKIIFSAILVTASLFASVAIAQMKFLEGRDYQVLAKPLSLQKAGEKEVVEFFSYACPHCANLNPTLMKWVENKKPVDATFYQIPALGGTWTFLAQVKLAAEKLGLGHDFDQAYFDAIHKKRIRSLLGDKEKAVDFIAEFAKIDVSKVEKAWNSLQVKNNMKRSAELWNQAGVTGVPTIVVNGKYSVSLSQTGPDYMLEVIDFLLLTTKP
ncbi:MAG: thiol:disulfide interchange protein DsbA/DsbL [Ostreibacterium sp.]